MSWEVLTLTSATALLADFAVALAKKSPPYLIAPFLRLWNECSLLHRILRDERFSNWKPQAARYVALRAIKARVANQESPQPVLDLLESFLKRNEPVVLVGEPGSGKTTALEAFTYRLAKRCLLYDRLVWLLLLIGTAVLSFAAPIFTFLWLASFFLWEPLVRRSTVPLFIEARSDYLGGDVNEWCEKIIKDRLEAKPVIGSLRRVALFIDGINEVQGVLYGGFVEGLRARLKDNRASRFIFTGRGGEENPAKRLGVERVLSVRDLDDDGVRKFLKVYGREKIAKSCNAELAQRDFDELQRKNLLGDGGIGRNPYWLKMIVGSGVYTINRGALFRSFAEELIRREIDEKPEERKRRPDWKMVPVEIEMEALAALALAMHEERRIGFSDETGWNKARAAIGKSIGDLPYSPDDILGEAQASTLLRVQLKKRVEFVHQLVQEFFAAYALQPRSKWQDAQAHCEDVWWWQTLFHLGGLLGAENSAESYCEFVLKVLGDGSDDKRVFVAIGLLRSMGDIPPAFSNAVIEAFGRLMEKTLILREGATTLNLTEAQRVALQELTSALGEEAAEAFAMLLEDSRIETQLVGVLILSVVGSRRAAELMIAKFNNFIDKFVGIKPLVSIGAPALEPLVTALRDRHESAVRRVASKAIEMIGTTAAAPLIAAALKDADYGVRYYGAEALVKIGAPVVEALIAALKDEDREVRTFAAEVLGKIGDPRAIAPLIASLKASPVGGPWSMASAVADALVRIGLLCVEPLIAALQDEDERVRYYVAKALVIGDARATPLLIAALQDRDKEVRCRAAQTLGAIGDQRAVEPLIAALQDRDRWVRTGAIEALGEIGDPRVVELLIAGLESEDLHVRRSAAKALGKIGDARAVDSLIAALKDADSFLRSEAIEALGEIGDARAVESLIAVLQAVDEHRIYSVAKALGRTGDARAVDPLIDVFRRGVAWPQHKYVREALAHVGEPAVEPLLGALRDANNNVRCGAAQTLGEIRNARAIKPLICALRDQGVRWDATEALGRIGGPAVEPLLAVLQEGGTVREDATRALGRIGEPAVEPLLGKLQDGDGEVRRSVAEALGKIGDQRAVEPLIAALQDEDRDVRWSTIEALGEIGDGRAVHRLIAALQHEDTEIRWRAASALENLGDARAIKPLIAALYDEDEGVGRRAAIALGRIGDTSVLAELERIMTNSVISGRVTAGAEQALREIRYRKMK